MKKNTTAAPASAFDAGTLAHIKEWLEQKEILAKAKIREMQLRVQLAKHFFSEPKEGANNLEFPGAEISLTHNINRKLDVQALDQVMPELPEEFRTLGVLVEYKPDIVMKGFRLLELQPEKLKIFQQALKETEGSPALEIEIDFPTVVSNLGQDFTEWPAMPGGAEPSADQIAETALNAMATAGMPATKAEEKQIRRGVKKGVAQAKKTATSKTKNKK